MNEYSKIVRRVKNLDDLITTRVSETYCLPQHVLIMYYTTAGYSTDHE